MKKAVTTSLLLCAAIALLGLSSAAFAEDRVAHVLVRAASEQHGMEAFKAMDGNLRSKATLSARLVAAESQLAVCVQHIELKKQPPPRFTHAFRLLWVVLSTILNRWQDLAHVM